MPSGHGGGGFSGGGHSGGHFGGGSFSGSRGGHFGGARSSAAMGIHRPWYSPRVMVFGGRTVYLGSGRASAVSVLSVFVVLTIIATIIAGAIWSDAKDKLETIKADYAFYHAMAENAAANTNYQTTGTVTGIERYEEGTKYCIFYTFKTTSGSSTVEGYSFYVYDYASAAQLKSSGSVILALDTTVDKIIKTTDSVPLDYKDTTLDDDDEYLHYVTTRKVARVATLGLVAVSVVLILSAVLVPLTAKKATAEQIAESKNGTSTNANNDNQNTPAGTWRCAYCGTLNDNGKERCDGCGAKRQK